jgi:hypothetical protein
VLLTAVLAGLAMIPISVIVGVLVTPSLWRLEPRVGMELAGHSGPASWVFVSIWAALTAGVTTLAVVLRRRSTR